MDFHGMKRKELQALCKTHGIPANLTNREMADRLDLLLKEGETSAQEGLCEIGSEIDSVVVAKKVKKVTFSPENETFVFVGTDVDSNSNSDLDYSPKPKKRNSRKRRSTTKNVAVVKKSVEEIPVRVTRARAQSAVEEDSKEVSLVVAGRKRGRRGKEAVDVCDKSSPIVDAGREESKKEEDVRQLRGRNVVIEAGGNGEEGDLVIRSKKISLGGSKKTRRGKGSNGLLSEDETLQENLIAEVANPQEIMKCSQQNELKGEGSNALSQDFGKLDVGVRNRRSKTQMNVAKDEGSHALVEDLGKVVVEGRTRRSKAQMNVAKDEGSNALTEDLGKAVVEGRTKRSKTQMNVAKDEESNALTKDLGKADVRVRTRRTRTQINEHDTAATKDECQNVIPTKGSKTQKKVAVDDGSKAMTDDLGKAGVDGRTRRSRAQINGKAAVNGARVIEETKKGCQDVLQLEEPSKGLGRNSLRRKSVAAKKGKVASAGESIEHGPVMNLEPSKRSKKAKVDDVPPTEPNGPVMNLEPSKRSKKAKVDDIPPTEPNGPVMNLEPSKRSKKTKVDDVPPTEPNGDTVKQLLPDGPSRRTRRNTMLFSSTASTTTTNDQLTTRETTGRVSSSSEEPLKRCANDAVMPTRKFTRDAASQILTEISDKLGEVSRKYEQEKKTQELVLNEQSLAITHEPVSTSKGKSIELVELTAAVLETNKQHEATKEWDGLFSNSSSLPLKEPTVIDDESNNALPFKEPPLIDDELAVIEASISRNEPGNVDISAVDDEFVDIGPNLVVDISRSSVVDISPNLVVDLALSMESQVSASVVDSSVSGHFVNGNENNTVEEGKEMFLDMNVESDMEDQSLNTSDDSTANDLSPVYDEESEGGYNSMNQGSDELDNQSAENDKANIEEDQYLEPIQDHLNDVNDCQDEKVECEFSSVSNEIVSIKEELNEDREIQQPCFSEPDNQKDVASELNRDLSFSAHDLVSMADQVDVEDKQEELEGKKCESPSNANEMAHAIFKQESNDVMQTQHPHFGELDNYKDVASELNGDPYVSAHAFNSKADQVNVGDEIDELEGKKCKSPSNSNEMASFSCKVMQTVLEIQQTHSELDNHVALELDTGASPAAQNFMFENDKIEVEDNLEEFQEEQECGNPDACPSSELNVHSSHGDDLEELQDEQECGNPDACPSSVLNVHSSHGDECRSHNSSGDTVYTTEKEAEIKDSGKEATIGKNQENDATTSEFYQARANYHEAAANDSTLVMDVEETVENSQNVVGFAPLPDNTTSELHVQSSEINVDLADDEANLESEYEEKHNEVEEILTMNKQVDETSALQVQSSEITTSETIMKSSVDGEKEGVDRSYEVLVEASLEDNDEKHNEVEELLAMNDQVDETSELCVQPSEITASETIMDSVDGEKEVVDGSYEVVAEASLEDNDEKQIEVEENLAMNEPVDETSELYVQPSEITAPESITDLVENEGVGISYEVLVEAGLEDNDEKQNEIEENLAMNEQGDDTSELYVQPSDITASESIMESVDGENEGVDISYEALEEASLEDNDEKQNEVGENLAMNEQVDETSVLYVQPSEITSSNTIMDLVDGEKEGVDRSYEVLVEANLEDNDEKQNAVEENLAINEQVAETSDLSVQPSEINASETIMDKVERSYEVLVEVNFEGGYDGKHTEVEGKLTMNEEVEVSERQLGEHGVEVSERQLGEHGQNTSLAVSEELISEDSGSPNAREDAFAIIQEYLDNEIHMDLVHEESVPGVAENKGCESGAVEGADTNSVAEQGLENMLKDDGEEDKEDYAMTTERTELQEENGSQERVFETELPNLDAVDLGDSMDTVSVNHEDLEKPDEIVENMLQKGEVNFGEMDGNVSRASDNSLFGDGETEDCEADIGREEDISNSQDMSVHAETALNHEDLEKPDENVENMLQKGKANFGDNSVFGDGETEDCEIDVDVGREEDSSKSKAMSVHAETTINEGLALGATASDVNDNMVEDEIQAQNDSGLDSILINSQEIKVVSTDVACDESMDQRIDFDGIQDGKLAGAPPVSPQRLEDDCGCEDRIIADIKTSTETTTDITLTVGEESPCDVYRNLVTDSVEVVETANTDRGSDFKNVNLSIEGNEEFATNDTASRYHITSLEDDETDDVSLSLNNLFSSNSRNINSEKTWNMLDLHCTENVKSSSASKDTDAYVEELSILKSEKDRRGSGICLDLHNLFSCNNSAQENVEVSSGASKESADVEEILAPERGDQQCSDDCSDTSHFSQLMQSTPQENKALERVAEESLSTDFKLNLHSECSKTFEFDNLKGKINEEVKSGEGAVVNISEVSASLVEVEIQNEHHFAALDEPIYDNEGSKHSVTAEGCQDLDLGLAELFEVKESTEATEISGSIIAHANTGGEDNEGSMHSVTAQGCQDLDLGLAELFEVKESTEATEINDSIIAPANTGGEDINSIDTSDRSEDVVETRESFGDVIIGKIAESSSESGGSAEKGISSPEMGADCLKQLENLNVAESVHDSGEDMVVDTAKLSEDVPKTQATSSYAAILKNNIFSIPATPKNHKNFHDMKENMPSIKREQHFSHTASKRSQKRKPLENLPNI